jgi:hypothetical protein
LTLDEGKAIVKYRTARSKLEKTKILAAFGGTGVLDSTERTRRQPAPIVDASISVIGSSDTVAQAVGQPLDDVLQIQTDSVRWGHVADELRSFLQGVEGSNLVRRERLAFIAAQAYSFGSQLARNPDNENVSRRSRRSSV